MSAVEPPRIVVMGVSAVGKSAVGAALAARLGVPFADADDLHSAASVEKMQAGAPLTDEDRWPWLRRCGERLRAEPGGAVMACSALRRRYRDALRDCAEGVFFVHLRADPDSVRERATSRDGHFMPVALLASQFATLEPLGEDEAGIVVDATQDIASIVDECVDAHIARRSRA
jgi:carbohydrate kinase (thermoresistant glucokinase family)